MGREARRLGDRIFDLALGKSYFRRWTSGSADGLREGGPASRRARATKRMSARFAEPAPPPLSRLRWEALSGIEIPKLLVRSPWLARAPRGDAVVAVLPGYGADDTSTLPLRWFLGRLGHDVHGWRLGRNRGDAPALIPGVVRGVRELAERHGEPVHLVGQSLGGVLARETARDHPDLIAQVITLGRRSGRSGSHAVGAGTDAAGLARIEAAIQRRNRTPIRVPLTIIYSRRDGIVNWRACLDEEHPQAEHVEVSSSHLGMGIDPNVWEPWRGVARQVLDRQQVRGGRARRRARPDRRLRVGLVLISPGLGVSPGRMPHGGPDPTGPTGSTAPADHSPPRHPWVPSFMTPTTLHQAKRQPHQAPRRPRGRGPPPRASRGGPPA